MCALRVESARSGPEFRVLDLFAGAGGLSQGLHDASSRLGVVAAVELDPHAAATYSLNHGEVMYCGSIEQWLQHEATPNVDVVVGGPPCQGFSTLGKQDENDPRNSLWRQYAETLVRTRPRYFILENVPAFLKSPQHQLLVSMMDAGGVLDDYEYQEAILNAADFGAFQSRKRAIVLGWRKDVSPLAWPVSTAPEEAWRTVREAFAKIPERVRQIDLPDTRIEFGGVAYPGGFSSRELHVTRRYSTLSLERFAWIPPGGNRFDLPDELKAPCWLKHTSGSGDVMGRLHLNRPSVTIRTEFFKPEKGRYIHPTQDRAITHYEAAVLQGFPVGYRWVGNKTSIARQIGNAVPVPLGSALGRVLVDALESAPR